MDKYFRTIVAIVVAGLVGMVWDQHARLTQLSAELHQAQAELSAIEGVALNTQTRVGKIEGELGN